MIVSILKPCSVKLDGIVQSLSPGARLHLPDTIWTHHERLLTI